jgi:hypothetical protein
LRAKKRKLPKRHQKNSSKPQRGARTRSKKRAHTRGTQATQGRAGKIHRAKSTQARVRKKSAPPLLRAKETHRVDIRIPQDTERRRDGTQFVRQQVHFKFIGKKSSNTDAGLEKLTNFYKSIRKRWTKKVFQEVLWLRVRYRGQNGHYKIRSVPVSGTDLKSFELAIQNLKDGFEYDQYDDEGKFIRAHKRNVARFISVKYERIVLLKAAKTKN